MSPIEAKKTKRNINEALARGVEKIKHKSSELEATFDWEEFVGLDWTGFGKSLEQEAKFLPGSVEQFGNGFNLACQDEDYREELVKVTKVFIVPAKEATPPSKTASSLEGNSITITLNTLASSMYAEDWAKALRAAYA